MTHQSTSIPSAIRDRISALAKPHIWTPDDFADLGPRTAVDQPSTAWLHRSTFDGSPGASTTPLNPTVSWENLPILIRAT